MRTIASYKEAVTTELQKAAKAITSKVIGSRANHLQAQLYLVGTHRFQHYVDGKATGIFRDMVGRTAKDLNKLLYDEFIQKVRLAANNEKIHPEKWVMSEKFVDKHPDHDHLIQEFKEKEERILRSEKLAAKRARDRRADKAIKIIEGRSDGVIKTGGEEFVPKKGPHKKYYQCKETKSKKGG